MHRNVFENIFELIFSFAALVLYCLFIITVLPAKLVLVALAGEEVEVIESLALSALAAVLGFPFVEGGNDFHLPALAASLPSQGVEVWQLGLCSLRDEQLLFFGRS